MNATDDRHRSRRTHARYLTTNAYSRRVAWAINGQGVSRSKAALKTQTICIVAILKDELKFVDEWPAYRRLLQFSKEQPWFLMSNRVLLPDGGRFWDRATYQPHRLVDYEQPLT